MSSMKKINIDFTDVQRNWVSVITVGIGVISLFVIGYYATSNGNLSSKIDNQQAQIKKLNADSKVKSTEKPKVEIQKELPGVYTKMTQEANDIASSQNALTQSMQNNGAIDQNSQAYQAAYYTLHQNIVKDGPFNGVFNSWNSYKGATVKAYPGEYDGTNTYKVLFLIQDNKDSSKTYGYITSEYHQDDNNFHNFKSYTTDAAAKANPSGYGDPQAVPTDGSVKSNDNVKKSNTKTKIITDKNGKAEIVKR